jgi:hypothetical protein
MVYLLLTDYVKSKQIKRLGGRDPGRRLLDRALELSERRASVVTSNTVNRTGIKATIL